jgi:lysophospholipase L1-like esterase
MVRADRVDAGPGLKTAVAVTGLLAAAATGGLLLFTLGEGAAIVIGGTILIGAVLTAALAGRNVARAVLATATVTLVTSVVIAGFGVAQIVLALTGTSDAPPAPRPDPVVLQNATEKIEAESESPAFRLALTEEELNAVLQDALAEADNPFRRITVDITNRVGDPGRLEFDGEFRDGRLGVGGVLETRVDAGRVDIKIIEVEVGMFSVPGIARSALEDMIGDLADFQTSLAEEGADVQDVVIGNDHIVVTGTNRSDGMVDSEAVVAAIAARVDLPQPDGIEPRYEPGRVNSTAADGDSYYVALGDSLAANVGVDEDRDGYVSRFHNWLEAETGEILGLRNFGIPGETSGSLLHAGQLDEAAEFGRDNFIRYVTIDIGANDLLGHLTSPDCSENLSNPACTQRLDATLHAYELNIAQIFTEISDAFPDATVVLLTTYNPFGFGFEDRVSFEETSNEVITDLNAIAAAAALDQGFLVADGFSPMRGVATATTHMVDAPPDIHPNVAGFDLLAGALIEAIG